MRELLPTFEVQALRERCTHACTRSADDSQILAVVNVKAPNGP